jgi:hypothetical protein
MKKTPPSRSSPYGVFVLTSVRLTFDSVMMRMYSCTANEVSLAVSWYLASGVTFLPLSLPL